MSYFFKDASGLNADIARHRAKRQELIVKIAELESGDEYGKETFLATYRKLLLDLEQSLAECVSKLGKRVDK